MLPTDQNISHPIIPLHNIPHTTRIVTVTRRINHQPKVLRQRLDGIERPSPFPIYSNQQSNKQQIHSMNNEKK